MMMTLILSLKNNDGLTLKNNKPISYKTGQQVADYGVETRDVHEALAAIEKLGGNCGVWFSDGIYCIDHSFRVKTKREAITIGRMHNQISVFGWKRQNLAYC